MATYRSGHATYYLDVSINGQNQAGNWTSMHVHLYAIADSGWSGNASGIGFSASNYGNGSFGFNGSSAEIVSYDYIVYHDANGYGSYSVSTHTNATGTSTFAGPTDMVVSGGLPRIPKTPGAILVSAGTPVGRSVPVNVSYPGGYDEGGTSVDYIETVWSKDGAAYTGSWNGGWGIRTYGNLAPGQYRFAARAHNAIGFGPYAYSNYVRVIAGGKRCTAIATDGTPTFSDLQIMRRWDGANWIDIVAGKRSTDVASNAWATMGQ